MEWSQGYKADMKCRLNRLGTRPSHSPDDAYVQVPGDMLIPHWGVYEGLALC